MYSRVTYPNISADSSTFAFDHANFPSLSVTDVHVFVDGDEQAFVFSPPWPNYSSVDISPAAAAKGQTVDIIRSTPLYSFTSSLPADELTQLQYNFEELADAQYLLGAIGQPGNAASGDLSVWRTNGVNKPAFTVYPDGDFTVGSNLLNPEAAIGSQLRFQTTFGPDVFPLAAGGGGFGGRAAFWTSAYLANATAAPSGPAAYSTIEIGMETNAGGTAPTHLWKDLEARGIDAAVSIATAVSSPQLYGKAECIVSGAQHEVDKPGVNIANGALIVNETNISNLGADTGIGPAPIAGSFENNGFLALSGGGSTGFPGHIACIAKTESQDDQEANPTIPGEPVPIGVPPPVKGNGWYNGFVVLKDIIRKSADESTYGHAFWHIGRFSVTPIDGVVDSLPVSSAVVGIGTEAPLTSLHAVQPSQVEIRLESTAKHADSTHSEAASLTTFGRGVGSPTVEVAAFSANLTAFSPATALSSRIDIRARAATGSITPFSIGSGLWNPAATGGDVGADSINLSGGYYTLNAAVFSQRRTVWGTPANTNLSRAAYTAYSGQTVSNPVKRSEVVQIQNNLLLFSQTLAALLYDLHSVTGNHGLIGP